MQELVGFILSNCAIQCELVELQKDYFTYTEIIHIRAEFKVTAKMHTRACDLFSLRIFSLRNDSHPSVLKQQKKNIHKCVDLYLHKYSDWCKPTFTPIHSVIRSFIFLSIFQYSYNAVITASIISHCNFKSVCL